jgi:hypothetical protein
VLDPLEELIEEDEELPPTPLGSLPIATGVTSHETIEARQPIVMQMFFM